MHVPEPASSIESLCSESPHRELGMIWYAIAELAGSCSTQYNFGTTYARNVESYDDVQSVRQTPTKSLCEGSELINVRKCCEA